MESSLKNIISSYLNISELQPDIKKKVFFWNLVGPKQLVSPSVFEEFFGGGILIYFGNVKIINILKHK